MKLLRDRWSRWMGREQNAVGPTTQARFCLYFDHKLVGTLSVTSGVWCFEYSEEWKHQTQYRPLAQFPDKDVVYKSRELWPFFALRIPSLKQEVFRQHVAHEKLDPKNEVEMLRHFGRKTASNPFVLCGQ